MKQKIFRYELSNAWGRTISEVNVTTGKDESEILCFYFDIDSGTEKGFASITDSIRKVIDVSTVEKINQIINQYTDLIDIDELEEPFVLDGVCNDFVFGFADGTSKGIKGYNMWAFSENRDVGIMCEGKPTKAYRILEVFVKISEVLISCGIDDKYLKLEY